MGQYIGDDEEKSLREQIQDIKDEQVSLPANIAMGYMTMRPELLKIGAGPMTQAEVEATLEVLAGEMRMRMLYDQELARMDELIVKYRATNDDTITRVNDVIAKVKHIQRTLGMGDNGR